jgi:hypothetical protein
MHGHFCPPGSGSGSRSGRPKSMLTPCGSGSTTLIGFFEIEQWMEVPEEGFAFGNLQMDAKATIRNFSFDLALKKIFVAHAEHALTQNFRGKTSKL